MPRVLSGQHRVGPVLHVYSALRAWSSAAQDVSCLWTRCKVTTGDILYLSHFPMFFHTIWSYNMGETTDHHTHHKQRRQLYTDTVAYCTALWRRSRCFNIQSLIILTTMFMVILWQLNSLQMNIWFITTVYSVTKWWPLLLRGNMPNRWHYC